MACRAHRLYAWSVPNEAESLLVSVFAPTFRFDVQNVYLPRENEKTSTFFEILSRHVRRVSIAVPMALRLLKRNWLEIWAE